jgi:poly(3-hydroxybutyrate) depolymerase
VGERCSRRAKPAQKNASPRAATRDERRPNFDHLVCVFSYSKSMTRLLTGLAGSLGALLVLSTAVSARAASLQQVNGWGTSGLPSDVTMYVYVPDKVVTNPPVLTLVHYCGGTAQAVFGQAQGGGIVKAADQYGFIMVVPSSGRCWDVQSNKTRTRDGMGDSHAIKQMVSYAIKTYSATPSASTPRGTRRAA